MSKIYCEYTNKIRSILSLLCGIAQHLRRCHAGNTTCIAETMETFVRDYKTGLREINLVSIDPLRVNKVDIIQSANSPVNINLVFKNISLYGLGDLKAKRVV